MLEVELFQEVNSFLRWVMEAKPGGTYLYHRGYLPADRERVYYELTPGRDGNPGRRPCTVYREPIHTIARLALGAVQAGLVHLTQSRRGDGDYAYIATRTSQGVNKDLDAETLRAWLLRAEIDIRKAAA